MILNIDLAKDFDRTNWLYLRMILTHLGFPLCFIQWIMCCITNVSYSVLINGSASTFFHAERGLKQVCPLSPLLFLLFMEGMSRYISKEKTLGRLQGIKITNSYILTHLLFVNDVLIFLNGSIGDITTFSTILKYFCFATGTECNQLKSSLTTVGQLFK